MDDITECISYLISGAAKTVNRRARELLAPHKITPVQYAVLRALYEKDLQTGAELSAHLFMDSATLTGVVDRLEKRALIVRVPDPEDRRANRLQLCTDGQKLLPKLDLLMDQLNEEADRLIGARAARLRNGLKQLGTHDVSSETDRK